MNHTVFIDLDGVLCDFGSRVFELFGRPDAQGEPGEYEIFKALDISEGELWEKIDADPSFWFGLKPFQWAYELVEGVVAIVGRGNTYFFTAPSRDPQSAAGKIEWMQTHFRSLGRQYLIGPHKWRAANAGTILIGDRTVNRFREWGGQAILFPQRWNSAPDIQEKAAYVLHALRKLLGE